MGGAVHLTGLTVYQGCRQLSTGLPPDLWPRLEAEDVRGPASMAVPVDGMCTASVEAVKEPPVPVVQKPPRWVGKQFWDCLVVAPEKKVDKSAGLQTTPAW
jgi:hypothetical protein